MTRTMGDSGAMDSGLRLRMRGEERRIASQHAQLDQLCDEVFSQVERHGASAAVDAFRLFSTALDAHMSVEEDIYFPALHGLRPDTGSRLGELVEEHAVLRSDAARIAERLIANDDKVLDALDALAQRISAHEQTEEELIARITEGPVAALGHSALEG